MADDRIERDVLIEAPITVVWDVISRPEHLAHWLADDAHVDLRPGGEALLITNRDTSEPGSYRLRFEAVEPPRRLSYRWMYPAGEDPGPGNSVLVEFTLAEEGAQTRLRLAESGVGLMAWSAEERDAYVNSHAHGWADRFDRLVAYVPAALSRPLA